MSLLLPLLLAAAVVAPPPGSPPMAKAVLDFYGAIHADAGGIPDAKERRKIGSFVTPSLAKLLDDAAAAEDRFMKTNKDSPPLIEGSLFTSLFEGMTSVEMGDSECSGDAKTAHCSAHLIYKTVPDKAVQWTDTVFLMNTADGWKVDDIGYGGTWDFGNKGRLSETLQQVVKLVSE